MLINRDSQVALMHAGFRAAGLIDGREVLSQEQVVMARDLIAGLEQTMVSDLAAALANMYLLEARREGAYEMAR